MKQLERVEIYKEIFSNLSINHNQRILSFNDLRNEYQTFYKSAVVFDSSHSPIFTIKGKDVLDFFNRISTNDFSEMDEFSSITSLLLNEKGRIIDKIKLLNLKDEYLLIGSPDNFEKIFRWIQRYILSDDVSMQPAQDYYLYFKIMGNKSESFFTLLFGDQLKDLEERKIYKYFGNTFSCFVVKDCVLENLIGYEIICESKFAESIIKYFYSNLNVFNCSFLGTNAFEIIRIEQGEPVFPNEINDSYNPYEVNLIKHVSFTKGCYIGQEVIARLDTYDKVRRNFSGFEVLDNLQVLSDTNIYNIEGSIVGELTSYVYSPKLERTIALGVISKKFCEENNDLLLNLNENKIKISLVKLPFIKI